MEDGVAPFLDMHVGRETKVENNCREHRPKHRERDRAGEEPNTKQTCAGDLGCSGSVCPEMGIPGQKPEELRDHVGREAVDILRRVRRSAGNQQAIRRR